MARPKKSSNYKVIQDIDLSKNNIYNVNAIVGNSYDFEPNDLIITTYDTDSASSSANAGNLILRAGVADKNLANSGSVHIFAGNGVNPTTGSTVLNTLSSVNSPLKGAESRVENGITVDPNEGVFIKSEISSEGKVSIEAKKNLSIESKDKTTFNSPNVTKNVTKEEIDTVGKLTERFVLNHTEIAKELNVSAGGTFGTKTVDEDGTKKSVTDYSSMENPTLTIESNHGKTGNSYINVDKIKVDGTVTEGEDEDGKRVVRTTYTSSDTNSSYFYELHAGNPTTLTIESNHGKTDEDPKDPGHSYINVDEIKVVKTVTEGAKTAKVGRETYTSSDINSSELYELLAGSSNPSDATLTVKSNHKNTNEDTEHSYINVDEIKVDKTVTEGTSDNRINREVHATTDTTYVSKYLKINAPGFKLNAGSADGKIKTASLEVTDITSTNNALENLNLGREIVTPTGDKSPTGSFVVDNDSVDIDTNTLNINVPNNLHEDTPTVGTVFELSVDTTSSRSYSSMHIDEVKIDDKLFIGEEVVTTGSESTSIKKSESAEIYTKNFVLDTNTKNAEDTGLSIKGKNAEDIGLSITGNYGLKITDHHHPTSDSTETYINVNHINVGTVDVDNDNAKDVTVSNSIKTKTSNKTDKEGINVILTGNSKEVSVGKDNDNKIHDVEINSTKINIKGGSKNNLHITSSLTDGTDGTGDEVGRLNTKGLDAGDSFIETDDLRVNKNFYANQFYIYWDDSINSLVFANSEHTPKV